MRWRRQLPAYSPLPLRAVLSGALGLLGGGDAARRRVAETLTRHFGAKDVLLTDSGTGALTLAIRASLDGRSGAAVALPAYCCYDLATAADGAGAPVVLYDLEPTTLAPDPDSLQRALAHGVGAVVLVHLYGIPVDPEPVRAALASGAAPGPRAVLIEDAAQGTGASLRGRPLGSFGDLSVLSFGRGKGNTAGRGGALLALSERGAASVRRVRPTVQPPARGLKELVQLKLQWLFGRPWAYAIPSALPFLHLGETIYHPPSPVRGASGVAARTLLVTWPLSDAEAEVRRTKAARLLRVSQPGAAPIAVPEVGVPGYLRVPFVASQRLRARAGEPDARALGIMPGYLLALCDLPGFGERIVNRADAFPGARSLAERLVTLPAHRFVTPDDLAELERWAAAA